MGCHESPRAAGNDLVIVGARTVERPCALPGPRHEAVGHAVYSLKYLSGLSLGGLWGLLGSTSLCIFRVYLAFGEYSLLGSLGQWADRQIRTNTGWQSVHVSMGEAVESLTYSSPPGHGRDG